MNNPYKGVIWKHCIVVLGTLAVAVLLPGVSSAAPTITTVAGDGKDGFSGDGGPAASLFNPHGIAVDSSGNLYIADTDNQRIRKVSTSGIITTVAGDGKEGFSGDGGPATSAELAMPWTVALDSSGNLYIGDGLNFRIRKVSTSGVITTVAGRGTKGFSGDGGPATSAELAQGHCVIDSSGNLYIADEENNRIRKVSTSGVITTVAGNGTHGFSGDSGPATSAELAAPYSVALDSSGNLFIVDEDNSRIHKVNTSGIIMTVAGGGTGDFTDGGVATSGEISDPAGIVLDSSGNFYFADVNNQRIYKVDTSGIITTVAGSGDYGYNGDNIPALSAKLAGPQSLALDSSGNLYITDYNNKRIRKVH